MESEKIFKSTLISLSTYNLRYALSSALRCPLWWEQCLHLFRQVIPISIDLLCRALCLDRLQILSFFWEVDWKGNFFLIFADQQQLQLRSRSWMAYLFIFDCHENIDSLSLQFEFVGNFVIFILLFVDEDERYGFSSQYFCTFLHLKTIINMSANNALILIDKELYLKNRMIMKNNTEIN